MKHRRNFKIIIAGVFVLVVSAVAMGWLFFSGQAISFKCNYLQSENDPRIRITSFYGPRGASADHIISGRYRINGEYRSSHRLEMGFALPGRTIKSNNPEHKGNQLQETSESSREFHSFSYTFNIGSLEIYSGTESFANYSIFGDGSVKVKDISWAKELDSNGNELPLTNGYIELRVMRQTKQFGYTSPVLDYQSTVIILQKPD
jgi:hypothetical protein